LAKPVTITASGFASRKLFVALILLLTLLALGLRFFRLSNQSLWTDEVSSIKVARAPLQTIYERSAVVNNSLPTYFLMLRWLSGDALDHPELRARWLSALAGTLSIPAFIALVYLWRRHQAAALAAGLLLATNPLHIWYSQETRAYALMLFFGLLTLLSFELARIPKPVGAGSPWKWWALYVASALAAVALHKTALVFPAACCLWHGLDVLRQRKGFRTLAVHIPIVIAGLLVLALKSYPPGEGYGRRQSGLEIIYTFLTFVGGYSFGPSITDIQSHGPSFAISRHLIQTGILFAVLALMALALAGSSRQLLIGKETGLLFLGVGVVAVYALISGFPYNVRYTLPALLAFLALAAALPPKCYRRPADAPASPLKPCVPPADTPSPLTAAVRPAAVRQDPRLPTLTLACLLLVGLWADAQWYFSHAYRKGDSRAVAQWLAENKDSIKTWTILPGYLSEYVEWYLQANPEILSGLRPPKEDRATSFPPTPDALILGRRHHLIDPDQLVTSYQSAAGPIRTNNAIAGFELYTRQPAGR